MKRHRIAATLAFAATLAASGSAFAAQPFNAEYYPFAEVPTTNRAVVTTTQETRTDAKTMGARGQSVTERWEQEVKLYDKAGA